MRFIRVKTRENSAKFAFWVPMFASSRRELSAGEWRFAPGDFADRMRGGLHWLPPELRAQTCHPSEGVRICSRPWRAGGGRGMVVCDSIKQSILASAESGHHTSQPLHTKLPQDTALYGSFFVRICSVSEGHRAIDFGSHLPDQRHVIAERYHPPGSLRRPSLRGSQGVGAGEAKPCSLERFARARTE